MKVFLASGRFFFYWHKQRLHAALLVRAWIEMCVTIVYACPSSCRSSLEGVDFSNTLVSECK